MPRGYKRNWFAIETSLIDHPKWMALSWTDRSKWLVVRALAERQPTGDFINETHLATLLHKEGDETPIDTIRRLVDVRFLDLNEDGTISVHGLAEYRPGNVPETIGGERNGPKRTDGASPATDRQTDITHTRAGSRGGGSGPARGTETARPRTDGETLKAYLMRIGAPIPFEGETNGKASGTEGGSDDDGKSRSRPRRRTKATG